MAYFVWIFLNSIMDKINWNVDKFILGIIYGATVVTIYSVASQLDKIYLNFSTVIAGVMLPKVAKTEEKMPVMKIIYMCLFKQEESNIYLWL